MEITVSGQAAGFVISTALGVVMGLLYDGFRIIRYSGKKRGCAVFVFDTLFWFIAIIVLFLAMLTIGEGELRIYNLLGSAIGASIYFLTFSTIIVRLGVKGLIAIKAPARIAVNCAYNNGKKAVLFLGRAAAPAGAAVKGAFSRRKETEDEGSFKEQKTREFEE